MPLRRHVRTRTVTHAVDVESVFQAVSEAAQAILAALIEPAIVSVLAGQTFVTNALGDRIVAPMSSASRSALAGNFPMRS